MIDFVAHKSRHKLCGLAAGVSGPARERLIEVDIEHDTAEIEQQRVGSAGGERRSVHRGGVRKTGEGSNGVAMPVLTQLAAQFGRSVPYKRCRRRPEQVDFVQVRGAYWPPY